MKFTIDGRVYESYQLSNKQMFDLAKSDKLTEQERNYIKDKIVDAFGYECCPHHNGENDDNVFARQFSNYVNGKCVRKKECARLMAEEHRYLQNEMFKVCMEYIKALAENAENGYYDPRNKYAVKTSKMIVEHLKQQDYPY